MNSGQVPEINISPVQQEASARAGQAYFWRLVLPSGQEVDQFDPKTGTEQQFPNWVNWVVKSPDDPYRASPVFTGVKYAFWIPVQPGVSAHGVSGEEASGVIIYRKNYVRNVGFKYQAYCIGQRFDSDNPIEIVYHICPAARYDPVLDALVSTQSTDGVLFSGGITKVTDPNGKNAFDMFVESQLKA